MNRDTDITIVAEDKHARRIISYLITRKSRYPFEVIYIEGEYHITVQAHFDLDHINYKLKGIQFYVEGEQ